MAFRRAGGIGSSHSRHRPYVPSAMRFSVAVIRWAVRVSRSTLIVWASSAPMAWAESQRSSRRMSSAISALARGCSW